MQAVVIILHIVCDLTCVEDDSDRVVVLCVLYHISMSEKCSALFSYTDCIPTVSVCVCVCVCVCVRVCVCARAHAYVCSAYVYSLCV